MRTSLDRHVWPWSASRKVLPPWKDAGTNGRHSITGVSRSGSGSGISEGDAKLTYNRTDKHSEIERRHLPDAAAVLCLLGKLCRGNGETKKAAEYYAESLKLNPFMWDAYLDLCDSGKA